MQLNDSSTTAPHVFEYSKQSEWYVYLAQIFNCTFYSGIFSKF